MTSYLLTIHSGPWSNQSVSTACQFAKTALLAGNEIKAIFLYQDGVLNGLKDIDIPSDELNGQNLLLALSKAHNLDILLCVTAAEKRGIQQHSIADGFTIAGLAEYAELSASTDKVIQFK